MRVCVTGGNGFIGAWLVRRLLAEGQTVRVFDLNPPGKLIRVLLGASLERVEWLQGDIGDTRAVDQALAACDAVAHFAGVLTPFCQNDPVRGATINVIGTLNVFEAAKKHGIARVVYTSSAGVYGPKHAVYPEPTTHYGAFKLATEGCARSYWYNAGPDGRAVASVGFRPFVVYGPGREDGASAGVSLACQAAARGELYTIPFTGRTGMIHVDDVVEAFWAALTRVVEGAHVFNLCGDVQSTDALIEEIGRQVPGARLSASGAPLPIVADLPPDDLNRVLPGLPVTLLADGVARSLAFFAKHDTLEDGAESAQDNQPISLNA
ncbi:NAD-dependent epimerase/dehydratase family protein [Caballeronia sp. GAWG2-1]|uniref:NAD-dependent epimerase/dehydratase family protein n=1 Tax=Caballeronia sp. GAWG2-1 TaxID=2921744 RepID=UPI0020297DA0|nr:NAD-dependent epimerase/dehydratase family protein [Caballeronia sp. GAWG2-1]